MKVKTKRKIWTAVIFIAIIAVVATLLISNKTPEEAKYDMFTMETGTIKKVVVSSASVAAEDISTVYSPVSGEIKLQIEDGDIVKKDDVIAKIGAYSVKAPQDGEVLLYVENETDVMAQMPLMKIIDFNTLQMIGKVSELDIAAMSVGQEVEISMNSTAKPFTGVVKSIDKEGQNLAGSTYYIVKTTIEGDDIDNVFVGMTGDLKVETGRVENVVTAKLDKISFSGPTAYIKVKNAEGEFVNQNIEVGFTDGLTIEVKGLSEGTEYYFEAEENMMFPYMG